MNLESFIEYIWVPVVAMLWNEIRDLRKKVESKASKEDIAEYLDPRMQGVEDAMSQTQRSVQDLSNRTHELIMTIMEWQRQQNSKS